MTKPKLETADEFNARVPVGTPVRYWPSAKNRESYLDTKTSSEAWTLGSGDVVVQIDGRSGGVSIEPRFLKVI